MMTTPTTTMDIISMLMVEFNNFYHLTAFEANDFLINFKLGMLWKDSDVKKTHTPVEVFFSNTIITNYLLHLKE